MGSDLSFPLMTTRRETKPCIRSRRLVKSRAYNQEIIMFKLAVFSDEVSQDLAEAIQFAKEFKLGGLSIRSVWNKKGPQDISLADAKKIKAMCDDAGLKITEVATPFYKCDIDKPEDIAKHHDWLKHFVELA